MVANVLSIVNTVSVTIYLFQLEMYDGMNPNVLFTKPFVGEILTNC